MALMHLDGARPSRMSGWVPLVAPVVTQAAAGAGHWAAGRRQRALAEWAGAAGFGLIASGLGPEAPTAAEVQETCPVRPCFPLAWMVIGVPWRLRHPRRLTMLAIVVEAPNVVFYTLGGPGRAAPQAEDGHRISLGRSRIGSSAAGSIG